MHMTPVADISGGNELGTTNMFFPTYLLMRLQSKRLQLSGSCLPISKRSLAAVRSSFLTCSSRSQATVSSLRRLSKSTPLLNPCHCRPGTHSQRVFVNLLSSITKGVACMEQYHSAIAWLKKFSLADGQLVQALDSIVAFLARAQRYHHALQNTRESVQRLHSIAAHS